MKRKQKIPFFDNAQEGSFAFEKEEMTKRKEVKRRRRTMKKFLAIFLALVTVTTISLTACSKDKGKTDDDFDDTDPFANQYLNNPSVNTGDSTDTSNASGNNDNLHFGAWVTKNDTVYVCHDTYLRYSTSNGDKSSQVVNFGASLNRIATNGTWDKVSYNDAEYYV